MTILSCMLHVQGFTPHCCQQYPEWLAENEGKIPKADYVSYGKQYQVGQPPRHRSAVDEARPCCRWCSGLSPCSRQSRTTTIVWCNSWLRSLRPHASAPSRQCWPAPTNQPQMQDLGQPPAEIVKALAPGLNFSKDGVPQMNDMGPVWSSCRHALNTNIPHAHVF